MNQLMRCLGVKRKKKKDKKKDKKKNSGRNIPLVNENTILEFELDKHENTYIVKVNSDVQWKDDRIIPFMIFVYKKDDPTDIDYIMLQRLNMIDEELTTFLREHMRIYIDDKTNCI